MFRQSLTLRSPHYLGVLRHARDMPELHPLFPKQTIGRRCLSEDASSRANRRIHAYYFIPIKQRPVFVEYVNGRAQQLSWSPQGKLVKRWKESYEPEEDEEEVEERPRKITSTVSSFTARISSWFRQMFLPTNYPHSVHRSYAPYHILQFFETTLGTVVSVLCNQALLTSVGVSAEGSIFGAVAVQWIIKDGAGEIAKLFFIRRFSPYFDSHPKTLDLLGECIGSLGSGLQIATLLVNPTPTNFLLCAAGGNVFKLIGNAIWFTTHIKFVRYFSQNGNVGDVAAKEESQASVAQLFGYAVGMSLLTFSHSAGYLYSIFALAVPVHIGVSTLMLRFASFELLTLPRVSLLANAFASTESERKRTVKGLREVERSDATGLFGEFYKTKEDHLVTLAPRVEDCIGNTDADIERWETCMEAFEDERYLLYPSTSPHAPIPVFFHPSVTPDDMLRSILHAARLRFVMSNLPSPSPHLPSSTSNTFSSSTHGSLLHLLRETQFWTNENFPGFKAGLEGAGWRTDEIGFADHGRRVDWRNLDS